MMFEETFTVRVTAAEYFVNNQFFGSSNISR